MTRSAVLILLLLFAVPAAPARGDEIVLVNGGRITGRVVSETEKEVVVRLGDGMEMRIPRSRVRSVTRTAPPPERKPSPPPEAKPAAKTPAPEHEPVPPRRDPGFFRNPPSIDFDVRFSRYPVLHGARVARFRAYEHVGHAPLAAAPDDPRYARLVREHGHGGSLSAWTFRYAGMLEIRYGDEVKFIAEITAPPEDDELRLIRLRQGPTAFADRLLVLLVRRGNETKRYATTTIFSPRDFRQTDLRALDARELPVRTYHLDYRLVTTTWLTPKQSDFLRDIRSPFGDSILRKIRRARFKLTWLLTPPSERPPISPELLAANAVRPVAAPGRPFLRQAEVLRAWGPVERARKNLGILLRRAFVDLTTIAVRRGHDYYVERDRIGPFGKKGLTFRTERYVLDEKLIRELTTE